MSARVLVCFAVPQEARPFQRLAASRSDVSILMTGMGARNAERAVRRALEQEKPLHVFSCGFAGGLDPTLRVGDVVYLTPDAALDAKLLAAGARPVSFFSASQVVTTAAQKGALRAERGSGAVDMESAAIGTMASDAGVCPSIIRSISDAADEDLPLDFNQLMTAEQKLSPAKLAWAIFKAPQKIPALLRLGRRSAFAAQQLAHVLMKII